MEFEQTFEKKLKAYKRKKAEYEMLEEAEIEDEGEGGDGTLPPDIQHEMEVPIDPGAPVEAGSDLVDGDLEEGETPYEGEDGSIEIENTTEGEDEGPNIDIQVGE